ncbi:MAG: AAA family ATPase [Planctomycetes bacterium]|nr:AAA family ATPase [Planctomycetota bacterium]
MDRQSKLTFGNVAALQMEREFVDDQATSLKGVNRGKIISVTSGKGGVGKTTFSVNLAVALAQFGRKTCLVDLDFGLANDEIFFDGVATRNLSDIFNNKKSIEEVVTNTGYGIDLVVGSSGDESISNLDEIRRKYLSNGLERLSKKYDYIILDTQAGVAKTTFDFLMISDIVKVVFVPEPTSIIDAYTVIKMLYRANSYARIGVLSNMVDEDLDGKEIVERFRGSVKKLLNCEVEDGGFIYNSQMVKYAIRLKKPVIVYSPFAKCSVQMREIARKIILES